MTTWTMRDYADMDLRTDAAILALPAPGKASRMYAECWTTGKVGHGMPSGRMAERALLLDRLRWRDGDCCFYCLLPMNRGTETVDHWQPMSAGGSNHLTNLRLCCAACNGAKGALLPAVDAHEHVWARPHGAVRCLRCPCVRPAVAALPRPVNLDTERKARHARQMAAQEAAAAVRRAERQRRREQQERSALGQRLAGTPGYESKRDKATFFLIAQASWLDDGGALHPSDWDDYR